VLLSVIPRPNTRIECRVRACAAAALSSYGRHTKFGLACLRLEKKEESTGAKLARRVSSLLKVSPFLTSSEFWSYFEVVRVLCVVNQTKVLEKLLPLKKSYTAKTFAAVL
jgi:hypothetical protein